MHHETLGSAVIDDESIPWIPFAPHSDTVQVKIFQADPLRGELIVLMKTPAGTQLPRHHHAGRRIVYTLAGRWKYREHDWIAGPGSVVIDPAASRHALLALGHEDVLTLNILCGDLIFLDAQDRVLAIEDCKSMRERYLAYCERSGIQPRELSARP